ncbi:MAG TPA: hypothetical protein VJ352_11185 [Geodermatophilus sp.]|nr:hypothetical protein [Geodermatophilus sp.]
MGVIPSPVGQRVGAVGDRGSQGGVGSRPVDLVLRGGGRGDQVELVRFGGDPVLDGADERIGGQRLVGDDQAAAHGG